MSDEKANDRMVWSCSLFRLPEEDEAETLLERLRAPGGSFWEDAEALQRYLGLTGLSQAACAKSLGRSQASVANRLRLLKLPEEIRNKMRLHQLTERHARALLRLEDEESISGALEHVLRARLNVAETENYVERALARKQGRSSVPREFEPLLTELERLRRTVPEVGFSLSEEGGEILFLIRLPKKRKN